MENLKENQKTNIKQMKDKFEAKIKILETKSENLAADNFEYAVENEELNKKIKVSIESKKKLEKEVSQLKVENQWLVSNKKKTSGSEEKVEDMAIELQELK